MFPDKGKANFGKQDQKDNDNNKTRYSKSLIYSKNLYAIESSVSKQLDIFLRNYKTYSEQSRASQQKVSGHNEP